MMSNAVTYTLSIVLALVFHVAVVALMMMTWAPENIAAVQPVQPYYIEAVVVGENPFDAREREKQKQQRVAREQRAARARKAEQSKVAQAKRDRLEEQARVAKRREEQAQQKRASELALLEAQQRADVETDAEAARERERIEMEQGLALAVMQERDSRRAVTSDEKMQAYVTQIRRDIIANWSRPPSARNGMQAVLQVFLVPTGEVVNVVVQDSSGNEAFDRSAVLAVSKAERFLVPAESRQFERFFREFTIRFRPEDLRL